MITRDTSRGQLVPLLFGQDAVAASQTDVQLPTALTEASAVLAGYPMPFGGEIVAITWGSTVAATAGNATLGATIDGTEDADTTLTVTTETVASKLIGRNHAQFQAGASVGAELTTGATWDGTTADLVAIVWVLLQLEGI